MHKMDIQIDIAREIETIDKKAFHLDLKNVLSKYFEINSIHIRKEIHTVEVERLQFREKMVTEITESTPPDPLVEIERTPLVTEFDSTSTQPPLPKSKRSVDQKHASPTSDDETLYY
ncbi:hypothetical protein [Marininema halotolerans]|uniref:Uncharacterized protein n=1 Tax=Marininema halotolerans TaxID=1155944 RepID=A0A1I6R2T1_9BACL|nr:hypothetical protein [Marininema halotolerans]SFS58985.1 hypothetical protein SAMN05444972_10459 [Marininema halotolerans]